MKMKKYGNLKSLKNKKLIFAPWAASNKSYTSYQFFFEPLSKFFNNILIFDPQKNLYRYGKKNMNKYFLKFVEEEQPDYIFFWLVYDEFYIDTLKKIKEISPHTKTFNFFGDDDTLFDNFTRYYGLFFDYNLILPQLSPKEYSKEGIKNYYFTFGTNLDTFHPLNVKKKYDVTFIGTPKKDRYEYIKHLKDNGIDVKVFGWGWDNYPDLKEIYFGPLDSKDMVKVANESKITLSFSKNYFGKPHLKGRVMEFGACNTFLLVENSPRFLDLFKKDKEIVVFNNKKELLDKTKYYLSNEKEREKISKNMYNKIVKDFDLNKELSEFFTKILKDEFSKPANIAESSGKVIYLTKKDFFLSNEKLKNKLEDVDFICFNDRAEFLKNKEELQKHSLIKSNKNISCCDCHIYSKKLGDYLSIPSKFAFNSLDKQIFSNLVNLSQLMVKKNYFMNNFENFKSAFLNKRVDFIDDKNTIFITVPLVRIKRFPKVNYSDVKDIIYFKFVYTLHALNHNNKLFSDPFAYNLTLSSILFNRKLVTKYLYNSIVSKGNWNKLKNKI